MLHVNSRAHASPPRQHRYHPPSSPPATRYQAPSQRTDQRTQQETYEPQQKQQPQTRQQPQQLQQQQSPQRTSPMAGQPSRQGDGSSTTQPTTPAALLAQRAAAAAGRKQQQQPAPPPPPPPPQYDDDDEEDEAFDVEEYGEGEDEDDPQFDMTNGFQSASLLDDSDDSEQWGKQFRPGQGSGSGSSLSTLDSRVQQQEDEQAEAEEQAEEGEEGEEGEALEELSTARHIILEDGFLAVARQLRGVFDARFADPRVTTAERFLWDYWHIPGQYTLVRTQAKVYFPPKLYTALEDALLSYGESRLGCRSISPIWMSYYVDGCSQELHCDNPHGPFAFVLSLTEWETRQFTGGETIILQPTVLNYWEKFDSSVGLEHKELMNQVEPLFNRLTVFDPRFPHGVRPVHGVRDPLKARLVLHGWFAEPSPFFTGPLAAEAAEAGLQDAMQLMFEGLAELPSATGVLTVRMEVSGATGAVTAVKFLADTLMAVPTDGEIYQPTATRAAIQHLVSDTLIAARFPKTRGGDSSITLPIVFD
ncbi:MAG: hypothetical protein WDW36_005243 [Sanguina aurantia]